MERKYACKSKHPDLPPEEKGKHINSDEQQHVSTDQRFADGPSTGQKSANQTVGFVKAAKACPKTVTEQCGNY
jgi:hypothetical protein